MENYINHLRPVKFPLAGAWPVWDFGDLISALCIRNGLGAATCALEHRGGLGKPSLCFNPSARFYFEAADLWIFRAEWAVTPVNTIRSLCPASQAPDTQSSPCHVFSSAQGFFSEYTWCAWCHRAVQHFSSHHSSLVFAHFPSPSPLKQPQPWMKFS